MNPKKTLLAAAGIAAIALLAVVAITPRAEGRPDDGPSATAPLVTLAGPDSRITERSYFRITDRKAWVDLWLRHVGAARSEHSDYYNPSGVPDVDFSRVEVVAVFQGASMNSAAVDFVTAIDDGDDIVIRFDDRSYQTMNGADNSTSFGLFVIPKSDKPYVLFENVQGTIGGDPEWKERGRLE